MAWLGLDAPNITTGWAPPHALQAPAGVANIVGDILKQRQFEQLLQQKQLAETIKNIQSQREGDAYAEMLRNTGLSEGQDLSGLSSPDMTRLVAALAARTPDTQREALLAAQTREANARAGVYEGGGGLGRGGGYDVPEEPETQTDSAGRVWQKTRTGWKPLAVGLQPTDVRTQNENQVLKEQAGLLEQKGVMDAEKAKQEAADRAANLPNNPYKRSDEYNRMVNRLKQIQQMKTAPSVQPDAAPQPSPAETGNALPTSTPIPTGKGADQNLATGFGKPVSDEDVAALGWARAHPDDPRSEAILRKLGIQ